MEAPTAEAATVEAASSRFCQYQSFPEVSVGEGRAAARPRRKRAEKQAGKNRDRRGEQSADENVFGESSVFEFGKTDRGFEGENEANSCELSGHRHDVDEKPLKHPDDPPAVVLGFGAFPIIRRIRIGEVGFEGEPVQQIAEKRLASFNENSPP